MGLHRSPQGLRIICRLASFFSAESCSLAVLHLLTVYSRLSALDTAREKHLSGLNITNQLPEGRNVKMSFS